MLEARANEIEEMEEDTSTADNGRQHRVWQESTPEIVEIGDDSKSTISNSRDDTGNDVYVAVGKSDLEVVKWVLDNAISPGARVFLVHVFPPITYIPTPVGKLARSQLSQDQVQVYINEENNRKRNQLQKYIRLCSDAKVVVETMLLESNATAKAILDLIPVVNITHLVMGTKRPPFSRTSAIQGCQCLYFRRSRWGLGKGEFIQKNAPNYCEVTIVHDGKKVMGNHQKSVEDASAFGIASAKRPVNTQHSERNFFDCVCFSGKFN